MSHETQVRDHLDLFSGLGCFAIAAKACRVRTRAFCESKAECAEFLRAERGLPVHADARTLDAAQYRGVWLVTGGPPCQPASRAGKQRGAKDDRWLWPATVRIVERAQPTWFLFENPPGLRDVGLDGIIVEMEALGYEVGTLDIPACAVDSPQRRHRLWIVGHAKGDAGRLLLQPGRSQQADAHLAGPAQGRALADTSRTGLEGNVTTRAVGSHGRSAQLPAHGALARSHRERRYRSLQSRSASEQGWPALDLRAEARRLWSDYEWIACEEGKVRRSKPGLCGLADGPSRPLLEALGNAIVWPIAAEIIAAMIASE